MPTQKEIKEEIKKFQNEIDDLQNPYKSCPGYKDLFDQLHKMKYDYQNSTRKAISDRREWIAEYKKELQQKQEANHIEMSDKVKSWFKWYSQLYHWGYKPIKISWLSEDQSFAIITNPGGTAGQGTPMGTGGYYYSETEHWLASTTHNSNSFANEPIKTSAINGRLTKDAKKHLIDQIPLLEAQIKEQN